SRRARSASATNVSRSPPASTFLFLLAGDTQPRVRHRLETRARDRSPARLARPVFTPVDAAQRLVDLHQRATLGGREQEGLLALHRIGADVGHVERIPRQIAGAVALVDLENGILEMSHFLQDLATFVQQSLLELL